MNKASKDVVDKAHQLGMDVKNHMGAISSEQETKLRQAFGGGSTVNTQSKATNNQKQQTTQNKPANKKPMNNKPGEQRNNQNRPNNQSTNGQQRNNNNQNRHGQSNTQNRSNQTNTNNQNRNTQNNNGSTTNQNRTSQNNNGGTTKTVAAKTVTTILVAVKIVITGITLITKTAIVSTKKGKKANINKNQRSQQYQHVNSVNYQMF